MQLSWSWKYGTTKGWLPWWTHQMLWWGHQGSSIHSQPEEEEEDLCICFFEVEWQLPGDRLRWSLRSTVGSWLWQKLAVESSPIYHMNTLKTPYGKIRMTPQEDVSNGRDHHEGRGREDQEGTNSSSIDVTIQSYDHIGHMAQPIMLFALFYYLDLLLHGLCSRVIYFILRCFNLDCWYV